MSDLISRQDAINAINGMSSELTYDGRRMIRKIRVIDILSCLPSAQTEIIRCKDCKYLGENDGYYFCNAIGIAFGNKPNWFCADGEREEQNDEQTV